VFVVELDLARLEAAGPLGLVPQTILERTSCVLLSDEELYRFRVVKFGECVQTHRVDRIRLSVAKQPFQDSGVSMAVPKLSKGRVGERDLGEWRQAFLDEALEPTQRLSLVAANEDTRPLEVQALWEDDPSVVGIRVGSRKVGP